MQSASLEKLRQSYSALKPIERIAVNAGLLVLLCILLYISLLAPLHKTVQRHQTLVTQKQTDLVWMQQVAAQVSRLTQSSGRHDNSSLVVMIANTTAQAGITQALTGQTPNGENGVRVRFENVSFDALVTWLGMLLQQGVIVDTANIERTAAGQVNASIALLRTKDV